MERLRELKAVPPLTFAGITILIGAIVLAAGLSPFVLVAAILLADLLLLAFFSSGFGWRLFHPQPSGLRSGSDELARLTALRDEGEITEAEFDRAILRWLNHLREEGAITEAEFDDLRGRAYEA